MIGFLWMWPSQSKAQDQQRQPSNLFLLPQGNALSSLSGHGFSTVVQTQRSDVASGNPAALSVLTRAGIGLSWQYGTAIDNAWVDAAHMNYNRLNDAVPLAAGFVYLYKQWRWGLGYAQRYSARTELGSLETEPSSPELSDLTFSYVEEKRLHVVEPAVAFTQTGLLSTRDAWTIGVRAGLQKLAYHFTIDGTSSEWDLYSPSWAVGLAYAWHTQDDRAVQAGLFYQGRTTQEGSSSSTGLVRDVSLPGSSDNIPIEVKPRSIRAEWPARLGVGVSGEPVPHLTLSVEVQQVFWQQVGEQYANQTDFSANIQYAFSEILTGTVGFHQAGRDYVQGIREPEVAFLGFEDTMQARYLAVGGVVQVADLHIDVAVADGHLLSSDKNQQTFLKVGVEYFW